MFRVDDYNDTHTHTHTQDHKARRAALSGLWGCLWEGEGRLRRGPVEGLDWGLTGDVHTSCTHNETQAR